MTALLVVDVQNDFCEGGALGAHGNDKVVPVLNPLMESFDLVVASKDWHPEDSVHFEKWPVHCVRETEGAEFHPDLDTGRINKLVLKGTNDRDDGYSAFEADTDDLKSYFKERNVTKIYVAGLTTDYCVKNTVLDAIDNGFETVVINDAISAVDLNPGDGEKAVREMKEKGATFVHSKDVI